jgi:hypothetical protein
MHLWLVLAMIKFISPEAQVRFDKLVAAVEAHTKGWRRIAFRPIGFDPIAHWCRGKGARDDCQIAESTEGDADQYVINLEAMLQRDGVAYGLCLRALAVPEGDGWSANLAYSDGDPTGKGFVSNHVHPDSFILTFRRGDQTIALGSELTWKAPEHGGAGMGEFTIGPLGAARKDLAAWGRSPAALRSSTVARLKALLQKIESDVRAPGIQKTTYKLSRRDGLPPEAIPAPFTAEDREFVVREARRQLGQQIATVEKDHRALHAALLAAFPLDRFGP